VPVCVFFSLQAASLVHVLYGQKWLAVAPLLPLAMGCGVAISIGATAYSLLLANDQSRLCFRSDMAAFFIAALPMVALIPLGLKAYLAGALVANIAIAVILVSLLVKTRGLRGEGLLRALTPPGVSAALAAMTVRAIESGVLMESPEFIALLASWLAFTVVYVLALRVLFRAPLTEIVAYLPGGSRIARMLRL
jgi:O-antigen/teichoic acid export membrane protein